MQNSLQNWSQTQIFHFGDEYFANLISDIRHAKKSITLETYIFAIDPLTKIILKELAEAAKRGCTVQLLVDGFGSYYWLGELEKHCSNNGINMRIYHPLPKSLQWFKRFFWVYFVSLKTLRLLKKLNKRNHRKITIFDQKKAYLGSLNFTQVHSESLMKKTAWRDTGISVEGMQVEKLVRAFHNSWRRSEQRGFKRFLPSYNKDLKYDPTNTLVRLNSTPRMRYRLYKDLLQKINQAQHCILITTAYFLPKRSLIRALKKAAKRGVQVQIIIPGVSDVPVVKWAAFALAKLLDKAGVNIYEYRDRVLHAKYLIIDEFMCIGSSNMNHRSFLHDLEVEVVLDNDSDKNNLQAQWFVDLKNSDHLNEARLKTKPFWMNFLSRIAFKIRYLL